MISSIKLGFEATHNINEASNKPAYIAGKTARVVTSTASVLISIIVQLGLMIFTALLLIPMKIEQSLTGKKFDKLAIGEFWIKGIKHPLKLIVKIHEHLSPVYSRKVTIKDATFPIILIPLWATFKSIEKTLGK